MLIEIADAHVFRPLNFSFVRLKPAGDDIHKGRLSFAVGSHQAYVLSF